MVKFVIWFRHNFWRILGCALFVAIIFGIVYGLAAIRKQPKPIMIYAQLERTIALEREAPRWRGLFSFLENALLSSK